MSLRPICVPCHRFYRPEKNGVYFLEGYPINNNAKPGIEQAELWKPYKLWAGDRWRCEGCGHLLISGVGHSPISEHYKPTFEQSVASFGATFQVNDC